MGMGEARAIGLAAAAMQYAHEIDHRIDAMEEALELSGLADVGLDELDGRQQDQVAAVLVATGRDAHPPALAGKLGNQRAADESGAAQHEDVLVTHVRHVPERRKPDFPGSHPSPLLSQTPALSGRRPAGGGSSGS